jgi:hypothetical protein
MWGNELDALFGQDTEIVFARSTTETTLRIAGPPRGAMSAGLHGTGVMAQAGPSALSASPYWANH